MQACEPFVDIHCHLLPAIDDGSKSWDESLAMAELAVQDGTETIVVTPHQLGSFAHNDGERIRARTAELQQFLADHKVPLRVLPGADVRIEAGMVARLRSGEVLTLADRRKHVLLELPHELYMPLDRLLEELAASGIVAVLSHPERNLGILAQPALVRALVNAGCLMQITAGSLLGGFGPAARKLSESLLDQRCVHFVSTDAHGVKTRRPLMRQAFDRVAELAGSELAIAVCCRNPAAVADGRAVPALPAMSNARSFGGWFSRRKAG